MLVCPGRYNKYSRNLPQTPWIIDGERKLESSVEELISEHLMAEFKADSKCLGDFYHIYFSLFLEYFFLVATHLIQECNGKHSVSLSLSYPSEPKPISSFLAMAYE